MDTSERYLNLIEEAEVALASGRLDEAQQLAKDAALLYPAGLEALVVLGVISVRKNECEAALQFLLRAADMDPQCMEPPHWLSVAYRRLGWASEATAQARRSTELSGGNPNSWNQLGLCLLDLGESTEAASCFQRAIDLAPRIAPFWENLGKALLVQLDAAPAAAAFREVLAIDPRRLNALLLLGEALLQVRDFGATIVCAHRILLMDPNSSAANHLLARAYLDDQWPAKAIEHAKRALDIEPENASLMAHLGFSLHAVGRVDEAIAQVRRSLVVEPRQGYAYFLLVQHGADDGERGRLICQMEDVCRDETLGLEQQSMLQYAIGRAEEDTGDFESAMYHYDEANRLARKRSYGDRPFVRESYAMRLETIRDRFNQRLLSEHSHVGVPNDQPVFVIGSIRSGTTLVEQILSCHSCVGAAGEQSFWLDFQERGLNRQFSDTFLSEIEPASRAYLELLRRFGAAKARVIDKMPTNYQALGLIRLALPDAKFIHIHRHPVDTCLSIWATPNAIRTDWANVKENVVFAYREYLHMMEHWRNAIPRDKLLEIEYEDLVSEPERMTRNLVSFCGLEWESTCLRPEENQRAILTPSLWQARRPVYATSTKRWRKFEHRLGPFGEFLTADELK
ncbi:MAG: sulfotransferase [Fimbriimonas sp.]|nr:sulfotransferase [Fimbriimonas sp.]